MRTSGALSPSPYVYLTRPNLLIPQRRQRGNLDRRPVTYMIFNSERITYLILSDKVIRPKLITHLIICTGVATPANHFCTNTRFLFSLSFVRPLLVRKHNQNTNDFAPQFFCAFRLPCQKSIYDCESRPGQRVPVRRLFVQY